MEPRTRVAPGIFHAPRAFAPLLTALALTASAAPSARAGLLPPLRSFTIGHGLQALALSEDGYLWLGTEAGLLRFDGAEPARPFPKARCSGSAGVPPSITALAATGDDLWLGTPQALCAWPLHAQDATPRPVDGVAGVRALAILGPRLWIGTDSGLHRLPLDGAAVAEAWGERAPVLALARCGERLHVWRADLSIEVLDGEGAPVAHARVPEPGTSLHGVCAPGTAAPLALWLAGEVGLSTLDLASGRRDYDTGLDGVVASALAGSGDGRVWVGTADGALLLVDRPSPLRILHETASDPAFAVVPARAGGVWVLTRAGRLLRVRDREVRSYARAPGDPPALPRTLAELPGGLVVAGALVGPPHLLWEERLAPLPELPAGLIVAVDGDALWLATEAGELWRTVFEAPAARGATRPRARVTARVRLRPGLTAALIGADGDLWVGGAGALVSRVSLGPAGPVVRDFDTGALAVTAFVEAAAPESVCARGGVPCVATADRGVLRFDDERRGFVPWLAPPNLPTARIETALADADRVWLATRVGLFRVAAPAASGLAGVLALDARDDLPSSAFLGRWHRTATLDGEGNLWLASEAGLVQLPAARKGDPDLGRPPVATPRIDRASIDGVPMAAAGTEPALPAGRGSFEVEVSIPLPSGRHRVRLRHHLHGPGASWVEEAAGPSWRVANLAPGRYRYELTAQPSDGPGRTSARAALEFELVPPLHRRPWARAAVLAGLALLALALAQARRRGARLRREALDEQRNTIAREIHDTLAQTLTGARMQLELARDDLARGHDARGPLQRALEGVQRALEESRAAVWSLRTRAFDDDLRACVERAAREGATYAAVPVSIDLPAAVPAAAPRLSATFKWHVASIVREAVGNACRHARARAVGVTVRMDAGELRVSVRDDGVGVPGRDPEAWVAAGHHGLAGMHERAARLGGELRVAPADGGGTLVELRVPWSRSTGPRA